MKFSNFIFIALAVNGFKFNFKNDAENALCAAMESIVQFGFLTPPFNVQFIKGALNHCIQSIRSTVLIDFCNNSTRIISQSSVILAETLGDVLNSNPKSYMNHNRPHLIVIQKYSSHNLHELVNYCWRKLLINVSFLIVHDSRVLLQTFIPYNDGNCNDTQLKTINQFNETTLQWQTDQFFPQKLTNFHQCSLKITTHKNIVPYIVREEYVNGQRILKGRVIEMIAALAMSLNFTIELDYEDSIGSWEKCIQKVANNEADLFIGNLFLDLPRTKYLDFSIPIFFEFLKFVVPPGRSYTQIENFARAFDSVTWGLILCVLVLMAVLILTLSFRSTRVQTYVFGARYGNAFMDFLGTIVGITGASMSDLNIPRIITMKFVLFCFVMRTLYQGSLFNFLHSKGRIKEVQSIDQMISRGYTFFMLKLYDNYFDVSKHGQCSKKLIDINEFDEVLEKISDTDFKGTLLHTSSLIIYKNGLKERKFVNLFCKEHLMTIYMVAYLRKNFYLTEVMNERLGIFHNAGLIIAWDRRSKPRIQRSIFVEDTRTPISLIDLDGIFAIYFLGCAASVFCFIIEIAFSLTRKQMSKRTGK